MFLNEKFINLNEQKSKPITLLQQSGQSPKESSARDLKQIVKSLLREEKAGFVLRNSEVTEVVFFKRKRE